MAARKSVAVNTSKLRWIFGLSRERLLGELFEFGFVFRRHGSAVMDVEAGVFPAKKEFEAFGWEELQIHKEFKDVCAEDFLQWFNLKAAMG